MKRHSATIKITATTLLVTVFALALVYVKNNPILKLPILKMEEINNELNYQLTTLVLAIVMILFIIVLYGKNVTRLLTLTRYDGAIIPEPYIGIKPKEKDSWKTLGRNIGIVVSLVTLIALYFQVYRERQIAPDFSTRFLLVLPLALLNSFTEEVIFRFSFASAIKATKQSRYWAQGLSAMTFGGIHYFGVPSGIPGVLLAGFLGWFLAKSILETEGFLWAWLIHFIQDVIIMFGLFVMIA